MRRFVLDTVVPWVVAVACGPASEKMRVLKLQCLYTIYSAYTQFTMSIRNCSAYAQFTGTVPIHNLHCLYTIPVPIHNLQCLYTITVPIHNYNANTQLQCLYNLQWQYTIYSA